MGELLTSGKVGNIQLRQLQEQRKAIVGRWDKTGLLENLKKEKKGNVAQLLENQASYLLESTTTGDIMGFDIIAFPMVRRVFSRLLANEIVSVQSMNLPSGLLFYLDAQVSTTPTNAGATGGSATYTSVYDAHYANAGYDYSKGTATSVSATTAATTVLNANGYRPVTLPYSGGVDSLSSLRIATYTGASYDKEAEFSEYVILPQTWTLDLFSGNQIAVLISGNNTSSHAISAACAVYNTYASMEGTQHMAQVKLVVSSVTVQVKTRKMKTVWTPELAQDLAAYHSIDAEAELTSLLSEELAAEIDREIIRDLINIAPFQTSWSYDRTQSVVRRDGVTIAADPASGFVTQKEWNETLMTQINKVSALIHKATLRGGANWIVCSTEVASVLEDIEKFHAVNMTEDLEFNMGIENIGTLGTRYKVYKDPYLPDWVCLIGHKGSSFLETGFIYAPYIPFQLTPTILDPDDFTPRKGIMTRYAKKVVNNRYYGLIKVVFPSWYAPINYSNVPTTSIA